eukprot:m.335767 g.335767  ORF g.335767 m.335767 type:complete len:483 (+) comp17672_c0_seq1:215-1663(+)
MTEEDITMESEEEFVTISVTINTLLGGAFLLEVDPMTRVSQVKDMLSQMQGVPVRHQSLVYRDRVLPNDATLMECGVTTDSTMSLVLGMQSALTNVVNGAEQSVQIDNEYLGDWLDLDAMDILDMTGLDEGQQDELLSVLFSDELGMSPQTVLLCRDGDKLNMLHLGTGSFDTSGGQGDRNPRFLRSRPDPGAKLKQKRTQISADRLQENARHRTIMADLQKRKQEKKDKRKRRKDLQNRKKLAKDSPSIDTLDSSSTCNSSTDDCNRAGEATPQRHSYNRNASRPLSQKRNLFNNQPVLPRLTDEAKESDARPRYIERASHPRTPHRDRLGPPARTKGRLHVSPLNPREPSSRRLPDRMKAPGDEGHDTMSRLNHSLAELHLPKLSCTPKSGNKRPVKHPLTEEHQLEPETKCHLRSERRCDHCNRRLKLATAYTCRCGQVYCGEHRYAETHSCTYDYKLAGRKMLEATVPSITSPKLPKI